MSQQWDAVRAQSDVLQWPELWKTDLDHDRDYLDAEQPARFIWAVRRCGTQLFPCGVDIPSPFVGHPAFDGLDYLRAYIKVEGTNSRFFAWDRGSWGPAYDPMRLALRWRNSDV